MSQLQQVSSSSSQISQQLQSAKQKFIQIKPFNQEHQLFNRLESNKSHSFFKDFFIALPSALLSRTIFYPFVKFSNLYRNSLQSFHRNLIDKPYTSLFNALITQTKKYGFQIIWRGNLNYPLFSRRYSKQHALNFAFFYLYQQKLLNHLPNNTSYQKLKLNILSGILAGFTVLGFYNPIDQTMYLYNTDFTKSKKKGLQREYKSRIDVIKKSLFSLQKVSNLYKNFISSAICYCMNKGIYFGLYNGFKDELPEINGFLFIQKLILAFIANIIGGTISYPFELIRNKMIRQQKNKRWSKCGIQVWKEKQWRQLYKISSYRFFHYCAGATVLVVYNQVAQMIYKNNKQQKNKKQI